MGFFQAGVFYCLPRVSCSCRGSALAGDRHGTSREADMPELWRVSVRARRNGWPSRRTRTTTVGRRRWLGSRPGAPPIPAMAGASLRSPHPPRYKIPCSSPCVRRTVARCLWPFRIPRHKRPYLKSRRLPPVCPGRVGHIPWWVSRSTPIWARVLA